MSDTVNITKPELPGIRRVVIGHNADGTPAVIDDVVPLSAPFPQFRVTQLFVQDKYELSDPTKAISGANQPSVGMKKDNGVLFKSVDIPPHTSTALHYTDTVDHLVFTHGEMELVLHDGSKRAVKAGDVVTQLGGIHQWNNTSEEWSRFIHITIPSKPVVIDGNTLDKEPFNAYNLEWRGDA